MKRIFAFIILCLGFLTIWAQYDMVGEDYGNGLRRVKKGNYFGFIDENEKEIIPVKYFYLEEFTNGKSLVVAGLDIDEPRSLGESDYKSKKYGMIDQNGEAVVEFKYDKIGFDYGNGLRQVAISYINKDLYNLECFLYGFINGNGIEIIPVEYKTLGEFSGGRKSVYAEKPKDKDNVQSYGCLIDKTGAQVCPYIVRPQNCLSYNGLFIIENKNGYKGLYDSRTGNTLINPAYLDMSYPRDGMIRVATKGWKIGYLDEKTLKMTIQPQYASHSRDFSEGLAAVENTDGEMGYINKQGVVVIPFTYYHISPYSDFNYGFAFVSKKRFKLAIINTKGEELTPYEYNIFIHQYSPMGFEAHLDKRNDKYHYFDHNGIKYDSKEERDVAQFEIMKKRAANGDERYYAALAKIYSDDAKCRALGLSGKNDELALQWFLKAADIKDVSIYATHGTGEDIPKDEIYFQIGHFYEEGIGTEKNLIEAKQWYERCLECDNHLYYRDALTRLREIEGIIDMSPIQSSVNYAKIIWPTFQEETTQKEYTIELEVNSDSKIEEINILVNDIKDRGIKTVNSNKYDLTVNQIVTLNEGENTIKVIVQNAAGTTQEEKTVIYHPKGSDLPSIEWLAFDATTDKKEYQMKLGIKSKSKVEEVNITLNGELSRGINTVTTDEYNMTIARTLILREGLNRIVVCVRNEDGQSTSEKEILYEENDPTPVFKDKRIALIIGNSDYSNPEMQLKNPVNDAQDIAEKLEHLGFYVILKCNATYNEIDAALAQFELQAAGYDAALFYYAGHGISKDGENYLLPINIDNLTEGSLKDKCLPASRVLNQMEATNCKLKIAVLDACRNDPLSRRWHRGTGKVGLSMMDSPDGTIIAFSTAPGHTASDGNDRNSPYTEAFLEALDRSNLDILSFLQTVGALVKEKTHQSQIPWMSSSFTGSFYFNPQNPQ